MGYPTYMSGWLEFNRKVSEEEAEKIHGFLEKEEIPFRLGEWQGAYVIEPYEETSMKALPVSSVLERNSHDQRALLALSR